MSFSFRGRRTAYDNIAVGSVAGVERTLGQSTSDHTGVTDPSLYSPDAVSVQGSALENGSISNIAIGSSGGIEDTENATGDKLTSDGETITNTPSVD